MPVYGAAIPKYSTHEELAEKLEGYFPYCEENEEVPNICGMALFCGFASRNSLEDYEQKSPAFLHVIKRAKTRCYNAKLSAAMKGKLNPTIFIFDAVNNHDMFNSRSDNKNEHTGKDGGPIRYSDMTEEDLETQLRMRQAEINALEEGK